MRRADIPNTVIQDNLGRQNIYISLQNRFLAFRLVKTGYRSNLSAISDVRIVAPVDYRLHPVLIGTCIQSPVQHGPATHQHASPYPTIEIFRTILTKQCGGFITGSIIGKVREFSFHQQFLIIVIEISVQSCRHVYFKRYIKQFLEQVRIFHSHIKLEIIMRLRHVLPQAQQRGDVTLGNMQGTGRNGLI